MSGRAVPQESTRTWTPRVLASEMKTASAIGERQMLLCEREGVISRETAVDDFGKEGSGPEADKEDARDGFRHGRRSSAALSGSSWFVGAAHNVASDPHLRRQPSIHPRRRFSRSSSVMSSYTVAQLEELSRPQLQALAKVSPPRKPPVPLRPPSLLRSRTLPDHPQKHGVKANGKSEAIVAALVDALAATAPQPPSQQPTLEVDESAAPAGQQA